MSRRKTPTPPTTVGDTRLPAPTARYLLVTVEGSLHIFALPTASAAIVGRGTECQIVLDHPSISRQHARLELTSGCTVTDLDSRNGTWFRGKRLEPGQPQRVDVGESFSLGSTSLLLLPAGAKPPVSLVAGSHLRVDDPSGDDSTGLLTAIAETTSSLFILGETGVGKEVLATRIHALSKRTGPLVAVNCAALSETLLESELFGHEKGAFTGAVRTKEGLLQTAAGGTLFLDEIGDMSASVQSKMLRAIETQSVLRLGSVHAQKIDVRFVAATHRDLLANTPAFRRDLYYRLAGFTLVVPPLRERRPQILGLATTLLRSLGEPVPPITSAASIVLMDHDWPGNVRELRNVMARARVIARGGEIDVGHLVFDGPADAPPAADERTRIAAALESCAGNQTRAAKLLGISRSTLIQKLRLLDIARPRPGK